MKLRASLTVLFCNIIALLLISLDGFLTVRYAPWGRWAIDASRTSHAGLVASYGDGAALLHKGLMVELWIIGPIIAIVLGVAAAAIYRRTEWWICALSSAVLIIVYSIPTSVVNGIAATLYIAVSCIAMKLTLMWLPREWINGRKGAIVSA